MKSRFFQILIGLNILVSGSLAFPDTKVAYYDDGRDVHWIIGHTEPRDLLTKEGEASSTDGFEYADPAKFNTQLDCDLNRVFQLATIAEIANEIENGYAGSLPQSRVGKIEISDKSKVSGKIVSIRNGQGTILSENKCFAIVNTAFHVIQDRSDKYRGKLSTVPKDLDGWNKYSPITRVDSNDKLGDVIDVVTIDGIGSTLEQSEENTLLVVKKKGCNPASPGVTQNLDIFDSLNAEKYKEELTAHLTSLRDKNKSRVQQGLKPIENAAGIYRVCRFEGQLQKQKAGISRMHFTNKGEGSHKQDLAKLNAFAESGNSGCPVVYRDPSEVDHFIGTVIIATGTDFTDTGDVTKGKAYLKTDKLMFSVLNGQIKEKLVDLKNKYFSK